MAVPPAIARRRRLGALLTALLAAHACGGARAPVGPAPAPAPEVVEPPPVADEAPPADAPPLAPGPDDVPFDADARAEELAFARDALRDGYAHLDTKAAQWGVDLDALYAEYEPLIRAADTWARYERVMAAFAAELRDAHVSWRRKRGNSERPRRVVRLGLDARFVDEAMIVAGVWPGSDAERAGLRAGDRIVAIDGELVEERLGGLAALRSWSRAEAARHDFAREWPASRAYADEDPRPRRLTRERPDGDYETLVVAPETTPRPGGRPPAVEVEARGAATIVRLRDLRGSRKELEPELAAAAAAAHQAPGGLVIDLRDNPGGYEDNALSFAAHLVHGPVEAGWWRVRLSDRARAAQRAWRDLPEDPERPGWSPATPVRVDGRAARAYPGRIAVLIDAGCRSSCETLAMLLRAAGARLVGERTGGSSGAPVTVTLPRSGATLTIPARAMFDPSGAPIEGVGVAPDDEVAPTRDDVRAGRDPALARALDHVTPPPPRRGRR